MRAILKFVRILNIVLWPVAFISNLLKKKPVVFKLGMDGSGNVGPIEEEKP